MYVYGLHRTKLKLGDAKVEIVVVQDLVSAKQITRIRIQLVMKGIVPLPPQNIRMNSTSSIRSS